jgi:hypothetical protein
LCQHGRSSGANSGINQCFLSSRERLLFIGCSLSDAELISKIAEVAKIFDDHVGPHYALVHKSEASAVRNKLKDLPFEIVCFDDFGTPLTNLIKSISRVDSRNELHAPSPKAQKKKTRIAVLTCDAVDNRYENHELLKEIKKFKFEIHFFALNIANLNSLNDFSYVFILSSTQRGKILIEDEWLAAQRIGIDELIESIGDAHSNGLFVFLDSVELDPTALERIKDLKMPVIISPTMSKAQYATMAFKLFKRDDLKISESSLIFNSSKFSMGTMDEASSDVKYKTPLPESIDPRSLRGFVGRTEDLKNLCKRILENRDSDDVLTVKGAGGIGKTMLVKKAAAELANRQLFSDGINFIDCEFIKDLDAFQQQIGRVFDLQQADDFLSNMREHGRREDRLVILDNAETLLASENDKPYTDLVNFISDYCTVVVTSRELLKLDNEVVFELRRLTTDEAVELFVKELSLTDLKDKDLQFLRERIVEELLDNNLLAIKLVTKSTPKGKNLRVLHEELEEDVFSRVRDEETLIFDNISDRNVERKSSIYASINYSYTRLNDREKIAFEILSLFPDGINMENFKRVSETVKSSKRRNIEGENNPAKQFLITDSLIKSLESKSIIEIDNDTVSLQSLVGRFAESAFSKRGSVDIKRFRKSAFEYNQAFADGLTEIIREKTLLASSVFWRFQKNFLKALTFSSSVNCDEEEIVQYLADMSVLCNKTCSYSAFLSAVNAANFDFKDEKKNQFVDLERLQAHYFKGDFDEAFAELKESFSFDYLRTLDIANRAENHIVGIAINIYFMEGFLIETIRMLPSQAGSFGGYADALFQLGEFDKDLILKSCYDFTTMDAKFAIRLLTVEELDNYINRLHKQQHLERIQANYLRVKLTGDSLDDVDKLVTVNPYAVGIKHLISAIKLGNAPEAEVQFDQAIKRLSHIKYYYVDAIVAYARFLSCRSENTKLAAVIEKGLNLAKRHSYRFLQHQLQQISDQSDRPYISADYPLTQEIQECVKAVYEKALNRV